MKAKYHLEHVLFQSATKYNIPIPFVMAVSGGKDSMALLTAAHRVFGNKGFHVVHVHHGDSENKKFRDSASELVSKFCLENQIQFFQFKAQLSVQQSTEAAYRTLRYSFLEEYAQKFKLEAIVLAHHLNDWLETQLIKIIRGTSLDGLSKNMEYKKFKNNQQTVSKPHRWRPWIRVKKQDIDQYVQDNAILYIDDPTNMETDIFRNWIRNSWLPELEKKRPGSLRSMAFSLITSIQELNLKEKKTVRFPWKKGNSNLKREFVLPRLFWESIDKSEKLNCLAYLLHKTHMLNVRRSQLEEVIKQLDKNQNELTINFKSFSVIMTAHEIKVFLQHNT